MTVQDLSIGMKVRHPMYGEGEVVAIRKQAGDIEFDGVVKTVSPDTAGLEPAEPLAVLSGLATPLAELISQTVEQTIDSLGLENPSSTIDGLAVKWDGGKLTLHPKDPTLQTKEIPLDTFFHKITMVRNNLRVLEQKLNSSSSLSDSEKFELQQYISKSYGSLTTFNVLFKNKDDQFSSK